MITSAMASAKPKAMMIVCLRRPTSSRRRNVKYMSAFLAMSIVVRG